MKTLHELRRFVELVFVVSYFKGAQSIDCDDRIFLEEEGDLWRYAEEGEFPWMVSIQNAKGSVITHFCGGSIATANIVLTACHCLVIHSVFSGNEKPYLSEAKGKVVVAGSTNNNRSDPNHDRVVVGISRFIIHPECRHFNHQNLEDRGGWDRDFGLVVLAKNLTLDGKRLAAIRLFSWDAFTVHRDLERKMADHIDCVATGWGRRRIRNLSDTDPELVDFDPSAFWSQLTVLKVQLDDFAACYNIMCAFDKLYCQVDHWGRNQLCATSEGQLEVCQGDSGGPLMCGNEHYVYAIVGWGPSCGKYKVPSVYPTIYNGLEFIKQHVGDRKDLFLRDIRHRRAGIASEAFRKGSTINVIGLYVRSSLAFCQRLMKPQDWCIRLDEVQDGRVPGFLAERCSTPACSILIGPLVIWTLKLPITI